ncbi:hypothetical protein G7046_g8278 [Stylonectria norvegica]|nr:hypothetical protein G7046_g8278 [Stylonectria norvegica]
MPANAHLKATARPLKQVSESVRERETFKYDSTLCITSRFNDSGIPFLSSELSTSKDTVLTSLAQLGACQTGTERALVSLFDADRQYIIAEATATLPLGPSIPAKEFDESLWLCGTAIPRTQGICDYMVVGNLVEGDDIDPSEDSSELPTTVIQDLSQDARFKTKPYCQAEGGARFYAAVPIRTRRGINIGVYCVINSTPHKHWHPQFTRRLRDISRTIMGHLETNRLRRLNRRNERMNRGIGSFIEGKSTVSGWRFGPNAAAYTDNPTYEGALNAKQQSIQRKKDDLEGQGVTEFPFNTASGRPMDELDHIINKAVDGAFTPKTIKPGHANPGVEVSQSFSEDMGAVPDQESRTGIFSRAANIIRESIEVEGCLYFDATLGSFRSRPVKSNKRDGDVTATQSSSSSDDDTGLESTNSWAHCKLLGFSTTDTSSIDGANSRQPFGTVPEKFLAKLLRRYPNGKIFNFDSNGELQSSDSSEDDRMMSPSVDVTEDPMLRENAAALVLDEPRNKRTKRPWARQNEGALLLEAFPGARSVAFVPIWDSRKERWYAGGFIYTHTPTRTFTVEGELSYLRAFGMLAAAEILRTDTLIADKAKSDALGSLSHELRSPLHGILLSAELLVDTDLSVFQGNVTHTLETCCRTLLDTIDHLLDYSKINNFAGKARKQQIAGQSRRLQSRNRGDQGQFGKKSLYSNYSLDGLAEEVIESVFAGFNFQHVSVKQLSDRRLAATRPDVLANHRFDSMSAMEQLDPKLTNTGELKLEFGDVSVFLLIDPSQNWIYCIQAGAIRRIIMNLFGNSLKYTQKGTIKVSLTQETTSINHRRKEHVVKLIVQDTGKGIGPDYLQHGLFKPFSQEDDLTPGTGLGLSLVKQITSQLRGHVTVESQLGVGTTVTVTLPLEQVSQSPETMLTLPEDEKAFQEQVKDLMGLRVQLLGFEQQTDDTGVDAHEVMRDICSRWLRLEVVSNDSNETLTPDLVLWSDAALPSTSELLEALAKTPNVVVCANALIAYRRFATFESAGHSGIFEFISQPTGPRKLAKSLLLAYKRWMGLLNSPTSEIILPPMAERPAPLERLPSSEIVLVSGGDTAKQPWVMSETETTNISSTDSNTSESSCTNSESATPRPLQLLLVDDNHINLKILSSYVKKTGFEYQTAMNGKEAVEAYTKAPELYACVLMDISMPVMDGFEASRRIRAYENQKKLTPTSIFALSGLASEDAQQEAFGSGIDLFLTKPVKLKALGALLESRGIRTASPKKSPSSAASTSTTLTPDVTHLVVGDYDTPKYRHVARERVDIKAMDARWIEAVAELWKNDEDIDFATLEAEYQLKPLEKRGVDPASQAAESAPRDSLLICLTGFGDQRDEIADKITASGGRYTGDLTRKCTHLIVNKPEGKKRSHAA